MSSCIKQSRIVSSVNHQIFIAVTFLVDGVWSHLLGCVGGRPSGLYLARPCRTGQTW